MVAPLQAKDQGMSSKAKLYRVMPRGYIRVWNTADRASLVADLLKDDDRFPYTWSKADPMFIDIYPQTLKDRDFLTDLLDEL